MKSIFTFLLLVIFAIGVNAQYELPVTFENPEEDTTWHQFANVDDLPENFELVDNLTTGGINDSYYCIKFTIMEEADPWAGAWSDGYGPIEITEENYMMEMMVLKDVISRCALKLEAGPDGHWFETYVENTVTDEWEKITFDMSVGIGNSYARLVFFPDFPENRNSVGSVSYVDNIGFATESTSVASTQSSGVSIYPNPATGSITVQSPGMRHVSISNLLGQTAISQDFQNSNQEIIDVTDLKPGIYFISLETANGRVSSRFIKE